MATDGKKKKWDRICKRCLSSIREKLNERSNVGGVAIGSSVCAHSRKRCVVNGQMT